MIKYCLAINEGKQWKEESWGINNFQNAEPWTRGYSQFQEWRKVAAQVVVVAVCNVSQNNCGKTPREKALMQKLASQNLGQEIFIRSDYVCYSGSQFVYWNPSCTCAEELPVLLERKWLLYTRRGSPFEMINVTITSTDPFESHLLPCFLMLLYIKTWRKQRPKHPACCVAAVLVWELQVLVPARMLAELAQLHGIHPILCNTLLCSHVRERCWRLTVQGIDLAWFSFIASCGLGIDFNFNWNRSLVLQLWTIVLTVLYEVCLRPAWGLSPEWNEWNLCKCAFGSKGWVFFLPESRLTITTKF